MIGEPITRIDGPLKVTGAATYTCEEWGPGQPLYGVIAGATIGHARIARIDTTRAEASPGVRLVLTHRTIGPQREPDPEVADEFSRAFPVMARPEVRAYGEPVALAVAATFEQARAAAALVEVTYEPLAGDYDLALLAERAFRPPSINAGGAVDSTVGDLAAGLAASAIVVDELYTTPYQFAHPMELHGCLAVWNGDAVTVYSSTQIVASARNRIAATLGIDPRDVRIVAPFVGGGFGSKLQVHSETILAVIAARAVRQPVKVTVARPQVVQLVGHRAATRQRVRLGAERDGRLIAFGHDVVMKASHHDDYMEQTATTGRALYAAPHRLTTHRAVALHLPPSEDIRAPGEAPGSLAIESAMDELAYRLQIDPVELRIKNEPERHPESGMPFSQRRLVECLRVGARRFGWDRRPRHPGTLRDGHVFVGFGMAAAIRPHFQGSTAVEVELDPAGLAHVRTDMTDLGTGTYTILAQVAADALGLPLDRVRVALGRSELPTSAGSGGSWGASNSTNAALRACQSVREKLAAAAVADQRSPLHGRDPSAVVFADGRIAIGDASEALADLAVRAFPRGLAAKGSVPEMSKDPAFATYSMSTYGAHFAEVGVDGDTGEVRLRRMLGVFDTGRILNEKTGRSQLLGGMIWGVSAALHEDGVVDPRSGAFVTRDLASYLVPVHADIPAIDVFVLDGADDKANALGAKGIGELGICGSGAAIANAVFNAVGVRVRDFPITIEKILPGLPR